MRFAWVRRVFASWTEFGEALVLLSVCVAGVANASRLWPIIGAMVLLLLSWDRYRELFGKAGNLDAEYRKLARLAQRNGHIGIGFALYLRARMLAIVLGAKLGHDALFLIGAFFVGLAVRWFWLGSVV